MKASSYQRPLHVIGLSVLLLAVLSCSLFGSLPSSSETPAGDDSPTGIAPSDLPTIRIDTGEPIQLGAGTLGPQGGMFQLENTGTQLDGFQIEAPQGLLSEEVIFTISAKEVLSHNLAPELRVSLPIISVETSVPAVTGEDFPDQLFQISLPLQLSPDDFAMFFIYDEARGLIDGLPVISFEENQIVSVTPHFSKLVLVEADKKALRELNIKTGFVHGVHTWQFANLGSYIAPGGHCAGQVISTLYYFEKTGGAPLFGVYDATNNLHPPTPGFWQDDRVAYRLASVAQERINFKDPTRSLWFSYQDLKHDVTYYSFTLALRASSMPQYMSIQTLGGGHAVIVYEKFGDRFYVSDPNFPASARRAIIFDRGWYIGQFSPYYSGPTAASTGQPYTDFYYMNKYWMISAAQMDALWAQFENGTIGDNEFPKYMLLEYPPDEANPDPRQYTIRNRHSVSGDELNFALHVEPEGTFLVSVYDQGLNHLHFIREGVRQNLPIGPGITKYMFVVLGWVDNQWQYVDGRWVEFIFDYSGNWNSGPLCDEAFETRFRWQVSLVQDQDANVSGTIHFHNCPNGGQVYYHVKGRILENQPLVLKGDRVGGAGDLFDNSPAFQDFTITKGQPPVPNFAP